MAEASPAHKRKAADDQSHGESVRHWSGFAAVVMAALNPPYNVHSFIAALLAVLGAERARVCSRVVADPARADYASRTQFRRRSLRPELFLDTPLEEVARGPITDYWNASRALSAMVRAVERATGAEEAGRRKARDDRLREAYELAAVAADSLASFGATAQHLAEVMRSEGIVPQGPEGIRRVVALDAVLPDATMAKLYRAGIPLSALRERLDVRHLPPAEPVSRLAREVEAAGRVDGEYAAFIRQARELDRARIGESLFRPSLP